jgi:acyl-CoA dehydrogenase
VTEPRGNSGLSLADAPLARAQRVAQVASEHAASVDLQARFPSESIEALRRERLLSSFVPREYGGDGCSITELVRHCQLLGQKCANTAMVYAMHQIQVASLVRHGLPQPWFEDYLRKLSAEQLLIASVTSEVGTSGDLRSSICCVQQDGAKFKLRKDATTISYGSEADALLLTARRNADSPPNDQVMVFLPRDTYQLSKVGVWDTLGMRGTRSPPALVDAEGSMEQVLPTTFADICPQTQVPFSHVLWSGLWTGIAMDAVNRARAFVRNAARAKPGSVPPAGLRLAEVSSALQLMRNNLLDVAQECDQRMQGKDANESLTDMGFVLKMNNLKVETSQLAVQIVGQSLQICGIAGYKNDGKFSLGRHLRDAHSATLMINNDRILQTNASLLLVHKDD